jgi:hypothetical protein
MQKSIVILSAAKNLRILCVVRRIAQSLKML